MGDGDHEERLGLTEASPGPRDPAPRDPSPRDPASGEASPPARPSGSTPADPPVVRPTARSLEERERLRAGPDLTRLRRLSETAKPPKPEREFDVGRVAAVAVAAVVAVVVPWLVFTRVGDSGPARPHPAPTAAPTASPPAAPPGADASAAPRSDAGTYEIVGDVACVRVRIFPGTDSEILNCIKPGVRVESDGKIVEADGFAWLHVEDPFRKIDGWIATKYVKRVR